MAKLTLTQIVNDEKMEASEKLEAINKKVKKARKAYGNEDVVIATPRVHTCDGLVDLKYLSDADKAALAAQEITSIRIRAIEATEATEGAVLTREIERLLATNSTLVNILAASDNEYI